MSNYNTITHTSDKAAPSMPTFQTIDQPTNVTKTSKALGAKLANLMKATKSSQMRNSHMGKISNTMAFDENDPPKKKSPTKKSKLHSPSRGSKQRLQSSPSMKNKVNLNKTQEEIEDSSNFVLTSGIHLNFDEENEDPSQTKCEQVNLDFGQFQKEEMTLEGISGMVHMENSNLI